MSKNSIHTENLTHEDQQSQEATTTFRAEEPREEASLPESGAKAVQWELDSKCQLPLEGGAGLWELDPLKGLQLLVEMFRKVEREGFSLLPLTLFCQFFLLEESGLELVSNGAWKSITGEF